MQLNTQYSKPQLSLLLKSTDLNVVSDTLLYVCFNVDDIEWIQDKCIELLEHKDEDIAGLAATCLGHIARIHSRINKGKVLPVLQSKLQDTRLSGRVKDALEDIDMFAKNR
jgi:hypothetical protein